MSAHPQVTLAVDCSNGGTAALAVNGTLVAAATETCAARCGERNRPDQLDTRGDGESLQQWLAAVRIPSNAGILPVRAIAACLRRGKVEFAQVSRIVLVDSSARREDGDGAIAGPGTTGPDVVGLEPVEAGAWQLAATGESDAPMLIVRSDGHYSTVFRWCHDTMTRIDAPDVHGLFSAISMLSRRLGGDGGFEALERLGTRQDTAQPLFDEVVTVDASGAIRTDHERLRAILDSLKPHSRELPGMRREHEAMAGAFCHRTTVVLAEYARQLLERFNAQRIGFVGDAFSNEGLRTGLADELGPTVTFAPFSERLGRAAGAALAHTRGTSLPLRTLALGPAVTESDVKATLDNCRLDYVYEPDWDRLLLRTSRMLARGNVVSWFNGSAPLGVSADPARAILCDPSKQFARENVNRFLRMGDLHDRLTVFLPADSAQEVVTTSALSTLVSHRATPRSGYHDRLRAAIDHRGQVSVQIVDTDSPALYKLLQIHRKETTVPGLIASALGGDDGVACSPRDAIRTTFSSAVDALVIERFLVMKDWWLLRSPA